MPNKFETLIVKLAEARVEFIVVGGVSAVLLGAPIVTFDLDICFRRTPMNITRLAAALAPFRPRLRNFPPDLPFTFDERTLQLGTNFTLVIAGEDVDLLGEMIAIGGYEQLIGGAKDIELGGFPVKVLPLEKLIETKRAAGRLKDHAAIPILEATLVRIKKPDLEQREEA